jgi:hypothetical protein
MKIARARTAAILVAVFAAVSWVPVAQAANDGASRIAPPGSSAFGKSLTEWLTTYWEWSLGTGNDPDEGVVGRVLLMPLPAANYLGGSGATAEDPWRFEGQLATTVRPGTPFVLPLLTLYGERYADDSFDDPALFTGTTMSATLTIDGRTVISPATSSLFTVPTTSFDPAVVYPEATDYGSVAAIWFKGLGFVSPPLPVGVHVIHLVGTLNVPGFFFEAFDNTWTVTVSPH